MAQSEQTAPDIADLPAEHRLQIPSPVSDDVPAAHNVQTEAPAILV